MSHIVTVQVQVKDVLALAAACRRLGLSEPVLGTARLFAGQALPRGRGPEISEFELPTFRSVLYHPVETVMFASRAALIAGDPPLPSVLSVEDRRGFAKSVLFRLALIGVLACSVRVLLTADVK
jgi:hypothetical protein